MPPKLDILTQGRELGDEMEIPRTSLVSRQTAAAAIRPPEPAPAPEPTQPRKTAKQQSNVLDDLSEKSEVPVALNVRVSPWVYEKLNEMIFAHKSKGKKIRKEKVVEAAIIAFLGLTPPE